MKYCVYLCPVSLAELYIADRDFALCHSFCLSVFTFALFVYVAMCQSDKGPVINYRGGGAGGKGGGSYTFVLEKRGGPKMFVQYKYLPRMNGPCRTIKPTDKK